MAIYRTKTYLAADWSVDINAIDQLKTWNDSNYWSLSFTDAHDVTQARDSSLNCSIKASLKKRLDVSKTFVLVVGTKTKNLTNGGCQYCSNYYSATRTCLKGRTVDFRSYIEYECDIAKDDIPKIVVLYNAASVDKSKCPEVLKNVGTHAAMQKIQDGVRKWDYQSVKTAMGQ